ncbi:hypothetical protein H9I45_03285 [Polaribacter haliotis]|uniref:Uncharacterized protein n=1 Tax=Polaribacter haliotis TaxID=1888915 RepID=A0A7L8AHL4_9FLAO|nr:hypothetical protein [Polaribacter haliotis]QOD61488.1 hypothetical protein H9I45_03285 [Polaribacter haliotis]
MAHHLLKFNLQPKVIGEWQPIVASQAFDTFYGVFVKFVKHELPTEDFKLHTYYCMYKIQNFKGAISMGFHSEPDFRTTPGFGEDGEPYDFSFRIKLSPFNRDWETKIIKHHSENDLSIPNKIFESLVDIKNPPSFMYNSNEPDQSLYLHPDQYKRDGDSYLKIEYKSTSEECNNNLNIENEDLVGRHPFICDMTRSITR